jgi:hypothetical protein
MGSQAEDCGRVEWPASHVAAPSHRAVHRAGNADDPPAVAPGATGTLVMPVIATRRRIGNVECGGAHRIAEARKW